MPLFSFFPNGAEAVEAFHSSPPFEARPRAALVRPSFVSRFFGLGFSTAKKVARCAAAEGGTGVGLPSLGFFGGGAGGSENISGPAAEVYGQSRAESHAEGATAPDSMTGVPK